MTKFTPSTESKTMFSSLPVWLWIILNTARSIHHSEESFYIVPTIGRPKTAPALYSSPTVMFMIYPAIQWLMMLWYDHHVIVSLQFDLIYTQNMKWADVSTGLNTSTCLRERHFIMKEIQSQIAAHVQRLWARKACSEKMRDSMLVNQDVTVRTKVHIRLKHWLQLQHYSCVQASDSVDLCRNMPAAETLFTASFSSASIGQVPSNAEQ